MEEVLIEEVAVGRVEVVDAAEEDLGLRMPAVAVVVVAVGRWLSRRRILGGIEVRGQQAVVEDARLEALLLRLRRADQHLRALVRADVRAHVPAAVGLPRERVLRLVIRVRHDPELRVVGQAAELRKHIAVEAARRIRRGGDRHAGLVRQREHALGHQPAVGKLVPLHDDVAVIVDLAAAGGAFRHARVAAVAAEARPELISVDGSRDQRACLLVEHGVGDVHPLHDLRVADREVHVRGSIGNEVVRKADADAQHVHADADGQRRSRGRLARARSRRARYCIAGCIHQVRQLGPQTVLGFPHRVRTRRRFQDQRPDRRRNVGLDGFVDLWVGEHRLRGRGNRRREADGENHDSSS